MDTSSVVQSAPARTITMLMAFTVGFALLGHEIDVANAKSTTTSPNKVATGVTVGGRILLGGFLAGGLLIGLSHAGAPGAELAEGLALVSMATSVLVYGGPVWSVLGRLVGNSTPTAPTTSNPPAMATTPAGQTTPTA